VNGGQLPSQKKSSGGNLSIKNPIRQMSSDMFKSGDKGSKSPGRRQGSKDLANNDLQKSLTADMGQEEE
jgi:hypothetical protein